MPMLFITLSEYYGCHEFWTQFVILYTGRNVSGASTESCSTPLVLEYVLTFRAASSILCQQLSNNACIFHWNTPWPLSLQKILVWQSVKTTLGLQNGLKGAAKWWVFFSSLLFLMLLKILHWRDIILLTSSYDCFFNIHIHTSILTVYNYKTFDGPADHDQMQKWPSKGFEIDTHNLDRCSRPITQLHVIRRLVIEIQ